MSDKKAYLINLETGGNQSYIFSTNKLRDIVGASELIYRTGTLYVERAIREVTGRDFKTQNICEETPIEEYMKEHMDDDYIEAVIATSGKAILLASSLELARKFISAWSKIVTAEAPGVDAVGVFSEEPVDMGALLDQNLPGSFLRAFKDAGKRYSLCRMNRASPLARFQRLPVVASCQHSGQPASDIKYDDTPLSRATLAKIDVSRGDKKDIFQNRIRALYPEGMDGIATEQNGLEGLAQLPWLGVIHADGNGLGQLFTNFAVHVNDLNGSHATGRNYVKRYRDFSAALDTISRESFSETVKDIFGRAGHKALVVPVVVGGDDLTVVINGHHAIGFAKKYMELFCRKTEEYDVTKMILKEANFGRLGMCAGICVTKPHFPFSESYRLAEELMQNAKGVKKIFGNDAMALDFHILYDSVVTSMKDIRDKLTINENSELLITRFLTAKPYVLSRGQNENGVDAQENETTIAERRCWQDIHHFENFFSATEALRARNMEGKPLLPSGQSHAVREDLFVQHHETQEAEWDYLKHSYGEFAKKWNGPLYVKSGESDFYTFFLDALEASEFIRGILPEDAQGDEGDAR